MENTQKNTRCKPFSIVLLIVLMFSIAQISLISSADWDNVKDYDKQTKTITIKNFFGLGSDVATITLNTPLVMYVVPGKNRLVAEFTIDNSHDNYLGVFKEMEFYNRFKIKTNVHFTYKVKSISYTPFNIYENQCKQRDIGNGTVEDYDCNRVFIRMGQKEIISWVPLEKQDLTKGEIKTIGIFTDVNYGDYVEWIPTLYGVRIDEWAIWTSAFEVGNVAYWRFADDGVDATGNGHDWNNFGQTYVPGMFANGTSSSAATFRNQTNTDFNFGDDDFTINFWANVTSAGNTAIVGTKTDVGETGWVILPLNSRYVMNIGAKNYYVKDDTVTLGLWTMVTVVGNNTNVSIYLNGTKTELDASSERVTVPDGVRDFKIGKVIPTANGFTGVLDELSIWNRSLTTTEISDLWNGGVGIQKSGFDVTLNTPSDGKQFINNNVTFNCSASSLSVGFLNISLILDNVLNFTLQNSSVTNNLSLQTIVTNIGSGNHTWGCNASTVSNSSNSATRTFSISNWFVNSQTFSPTTTIGAVEKFTINITYDNSKFTNIKSTLFYNNTSYEGTLIGSGGTIEFNKVITIPSVVSNTNITFYWEIGLYNGTWSYFNSTFQNQTVNLMNLDDCSTFTNVIYNFTLYDEETQILLDNSTVEIQLNLFDVSRTISIVKFSQKFNNTNPIQICFNGSILSNVNYSVDSVIKYSANNTKNNISYAQESYNILNGLLTNTSVPNNINLYDLNEDDSTEFQLTFRDTSFSVAPNIMVYLYRQYVADNTFKVVEVPLTDSNGQTVLHMVRNDVVYNLVMVDKNGDIVGSFNKIIAFCQDFTIGSCTIRLDAKSEGDKIYSYTDDLGISYTNPIYSSVTNLVSFDFVSNDLTSRTVSVEITRNNAFGNRSVCTNSVIAPTGTLSCDVSEVSDTDRYLFINIYIDGLLKAQSTIDLESDDFNFGTFTGAFYAFLLILAIITMFMEDRQMLILVLIIGWAAVLALGLIKGAIIGSLSAGIWIIVSGIILIWKLNQGETR